MTLPSRWLLYGRLLFLLTAGSGCSEFAFCQHFYIQKFTANDGLADSYVLHLLQDSQGFLWVGTYNGLSRFDGKEFVNYGYAAGLPNLAVDMVYEDHTGRIWVGTRRGIVEIKGRTCVSYPMSDRLPIFYVYDIQETRDHTLRALTDKGAYVFDRGIWKKQALYPGYENHDCRNVVETGKSIYINYGNVLVHGDSNGVYSVVEKLNQSLHHYGKLAGYGNKLYLSLPDRLLFLREGDTSVPLFQQVLYQKDLLGFVCDRHDRLWISTAKGGLLVSRNNHTEQVSDTIPISFNLLSSLYEDREGNMWAGCFDGLMKIRDIHYSLFDDQHHHQLKETRNLVIVDSNVVACTQKGLVEYREGRFAGKPFVPMPRRPSETTDDLVDFSTQDGQGRTWLVTRKKKILLLDGRREKELTDHIHVRGDFCWGVAYNTFDKKIYLGSDSLLCGDEQGMHLFRGIDGTVIVRPRALHSFEDGSLLVYTADNEFFRIDSGRSVRNITKSMGIEGACTAVYVCTEPVRAVLSQGSQVSQVSQGSRAASLNGGVTGRFWIAYNGGLIRCHWNAQGLPVQELKLTARDGLPNNAVHALTMDHQGRLWAVTSSGLVVVDVNGSPSFKPVIHRLSEEMGITHDQWIQARLLTATDGAVWMCLLNSVYRFDPDALQFDHTPPATSLEDIQLNLQPTQWKDRTDSLYGYQQLPRRAVLPYQLNTLSISYKAPCFSGASGIEYSYQLEGADSGWSRPFRNNSVSFVKLPPGSYHFKVRARKSDTDWGAAADFSFLIEHPWWQSIWVKLLVLVALMAFVAVIFLLRIRQIRRKSSIREQLQELELKALRSQMNPHFIYNALNSIQALVMDRKSEEASMYIGKFGRLLRKVLDHSEQNVITLGEELEALELYIQLERLRLNVSLEYSIVVDPAITMDEECLPPLVLQPFAENALWHGLSRKKGLRKLDLRVDLQGEWLVVKIIDNGIGRRQAAVRRTAGRQEVVSRGMDITGRRLKEYNRGPQPSSIDITDLYDSTGAPAGTMITLYIKRVR